MLVSSANRIGFDGSEDHLYRLRGTKDQILNLEEHHVLFCPF